MKVKIQKNFVIQTPEEWLFAAPPKGKDYQWKDNYSAKELAKFATSLEFAPLLSDLIKMMGCKNSDVDCFPEEETPLPFSYRGPRNHDLLVVGQDFIIGIEAKVNEPFSETLQKEFEKGSQDKKNRIEWMKSILLEDESQSYNSLKYQLFSGTCGTLLETYRSLEKHNKDIKKCMFLVLSFDLEGNGGNKQNNEDFLNFCKAIKLDDQKKKKVKLNDPEKQSETKEIVCYVVKKSISLLKQYKVD